MESIGRQTAAALLAREKFELNTCIEETMGCLEKVQLAFVYIGLPDVKRVSDYIRNLTEPLNGRYGKPCVYFLEGTLENPVVGEVHGNVKTPLAGYRWNWRSTSRTSLSLRHSPNTRVSP